MPRTPFAQQWIDKLKTDDQSTFIKGTFFNRRSLDKDCPACALGKAAQLHPNFDGSWCGLKGDSICSLLGVNDDYFTNTIYYPVVKMNDTDGKTGKEIAEYLESVLV